MSGPVAVRYDARNPASRWYFRTQAERLFRYEREVCRKVRHVVAVSEADAAVFRKEFGASRVSAIPTGVDLEYFTPPARTETGADLVFVGAMDYQANIQGWAISSARSCRASGSGSPVVRWRSWGAVPCRQSATWRNATP